MVRPSMAMLVAALLCGCPHKAPPAVVEARVVYRGDLPASLTDEALAARALDRLRRTGAIRVAAGASPRAGVDFRLTLDARMVLQPGAGEGILRAPLTARLSHIGARPHERAIESNAMAERSVPAGQVPDAALQRAHLERAIDDVIDALAAKTRAEVATGAELAALIAGSDVEVRNEAIAAAGARREPATVPALIALLRSDDGEVRDRALGALIDIRDPRAARPITELARLNNREEMPKIIDALGVIGGEEARSYLRFVVSSHDDEELRHMARAALARLDSAPPVAAPGRP